MPRSSYCIPSKGACYVLALIGIVVGLAAVTGVIVGGIALDNTADLERALKKVSSAMSTAVAEVSAQVKPASPVPSASSVPASPSSTPAAGWPGNCPVGGMPALCTATGNNAACCAANSAAIGALDTRVSNAENAIDALEADVDTLFDDVAALDADVAALGADIGAVNKTVNSIVNGSAADYHYPIHRDPLRCEQVLEYATQIIEARYNNLSWATFEVPLDDWTGGAGLSRHRLPFLVTLRPANMSADAFFEAIIALSMRAYIQCAPGSRAIEAYDDANNAGAGRRRGADGASFVFGRFAGHLRRISDDVTPQYTFFGQNISLDRLFAARLCVDMMISLSSWYGNPNLNLENMVFSLYYSTNRHNLISQLVTFDAYQNGYFHFEPMIYGLAYTAMAWPLSLPFSQLSLEQREALRYIPETEAIGSRVWAASADSEIAATGVYFNPVYFLDPTIAVIFTNSTDPEGFARQDDQTAALWVSLNTKIDMTRWTVAAPNTTDRSFLAPFRKLNVIDKAGNALLRYDAPNALQYTIPAMLTSVLGAAEANLLISKWEYVWDNMVRPEIQRFAAAARARYTPAQMSNDHYTGHWRGAHRLVTLVERNMTTGRASAYRVPFNDANPAGPQLRIPLSASENAAYAAAQAGPLGATTSSLTQRFVAAQGRIADIERWMLSDLENAVSAHTGDTYIVLRKFNTSKGIIGGSPYPSVNDIITNYIAEENVVMPYGQTGDLVDLVSRSGSELSRMFFDIREMLADTLVKEKYALFGFPDQASAGLYLLNGTGQVVTLDIVQRYAQNSAVADARSDLDCLGRHYGYTAGGAINASEPADPAPYVFNSCMDYIYRQHYAIDNSLPLIPSNKYDPVTAKEKYQFTDPGDGTRRIAFETAFRTLEATTGAQVHSGKRGTYMRYKTDYYFQVLARYVVDTAVDNDLLSAEFNELYFNSTVYKSFDPASFAATGPQRVIYRVRGQVSGSANSGTTADLLRNHVNITIAFTTIVPFVATSELGTMLHEGALGHGFDRVPNLVNRLRGIDPATGWPTTSSAVGIFDESRTYRYSFPAPSYASLGEGWATLGEIIGMINKYYVLFDSNGVPIPNSQDTTAALNSIISLGRIAARQTVAMGSNFARNAWSFNRALTEFMTQTGFSVASSVNFIDRFYLHPMQQTSYANGFITNVGLISYINNTLAAQCFCFNMSKFIEFRILRTDYIAGASLFEIATQNIYLFRNDDLLPCPFAPPCAKKRSIASVEEHEEKLSARGKRMWHHEHMPSRPEHAALDTAALLRPSYNVVDPVELSWPVYNEREVDVL